MRSPPNQRRVITNGSGRTGQECTGKAAAASLVRQNVAGGTSHLRMTRNSGSLVRRSKNGRTTTTAGEHLAAPPRATEQTLATRA